MSSTISEFEEFFDTLFLGHVLPEPKTRYVEKDYAQIIQKWRHLWSRNLHQKTGDWRIGGYDWHVFTYNYANSTTGEASLEAYSQRRNSRGYVFTHEGGTPLCCYTEKLPSVEAIKYSLSLFKELADIYIVDKEFNWTFVYTHETESGIGPFFSTGHSDK